MQDKKKFRLFDMNRDGHGVSKDEGPLKPTLLNLPKFYFRHFTNMLNLNFVMLPMWIIPLLIFYMYVTAPTTPSQSHVLYSTLYGSYLLDGSPAWSSLLGIYGIQINLPVFDTVRIWVDIGLAVLMACLWGWINTGATYCARGYFRGDPVFIWSDVKYAVGKNLWQGFFVGIIDFVCLCFLGYDLIYFSQRGGTFALDFMFFGICAVTAIYLFMRMYFYIMLITFDISLRKLIKNSLIFSILGIKRNLIAALAILVLVGLNAALILIFWPINVVVPIILPIIYLLPSICLFKVYATYPVLEQYMINS